MTDTFDALVIATFGRHLLVRDAAGRELKARPFGRGLVIVAGDIVACSEDAAQQRDTRAGVASATQCAVSIKCARRC